MMHVSRGISVGPVALEVMFMLAVFHVQLSPFLFSNYLVFLFYLLFEEEFNMLGNSAYFLADCHIWMVIMKLQPAAG